jgi:ABC-type branched-subunit amino acid transport system substrate-binding protein
VKNRLIAAGALIALLSTACGSRLSDSRLEAGAGSGGGGGTATQQTAGGGDGGDGGESATKFGTLDTPCGPAPEGGVTTPEGVQGLTADSIKIGVISDKAGVVKVPTISVEESTKAFVTYCNDLGGINGRKLDLKTYDAQLLASDKAATQACNDHLFALVGTGAVFDDKVAQITVKCGLVNVPAYTATAPAAMADLMVQPLPNPTDHFNTAPGRWMAEQHPDAVKKAGILASDLSTATVQADRVEEAYKTIGFDYVYRKNTGIIMTSYSAEVAEMQSKGVQYVSMVSATSETNKLLRDMKTAGLTPEVIDLGQQYYDAELLTEPGADGAYVQSNTTPFEDVKDVPALQQFEAAYAKVGTKVKATSLGVQAFSAGLLFATAAKEAGSDLTPETLLAKLKAIHKWDGGGLHYETDPGANAASPCFVYLKVTGGKFERLFPEKPGTFQCEDASKVVIPLTGDYGTGAKVGS